MDDDTDREDRAERETARILAEIEYNSAQHARLRNIELIVWIMVGGAFPFFTLVSIAPDGKATFEDIFARVAVPLLIGFCVSAFVFEALECTPVAGSDRAELNVSDAMMEALRSTRLETTNVYRD